MFIKQFGQIVKADFSKVVKIFTEKGFLVCLLISSLLLVYYFNKPLSNPNKTFFSTTGDGLQAYYTTIYHAKFEPTLFTQQCMNYPFGENVFFTGCQPLVSNGLRAFGLENYAVGATNLIMLLSIVFCALCVYLVLKELGVRWWLGALGGALIAFLSPQLCRMGGHFTLTYNFAIPGLVWLLMKFSNKPNYKRSLLVFSHVLFLTLTHGYFYPMLAILLCFFWLGFVIKHSLNLATLKFSALHFIIQAVVPYLILTVLVGLFNGAPDRTNNPWGFFSGLSSLEKVLNTWLPSTYPLFQFFKISRTDQTGSWEGNSYVGLVAAIFTIALGLRFGLNLIVFKFKKAFSITPDWRINFLVIGAFVALLISFGWPFIFGKQEWIKDIGIIKQLRAIGRFAWLYFYLINVLTIYFINHLINYKWPVVLKTLFVSLLLFTFLAEANDNALSISGSINGKISEVNDKKNKSYSNRWVKEIDKTKYQAIIALPFIHIGSEALWIHEPESDIQTTGYIVSLKTGLPIVDVTASRTSIGQTFTTMDLFYTPDSIPDFFKYLTSDKPFLLVIDEKNVREEERFLLDISTLLTTSPKFQLRELNKTDFYNYYVNTIKARRDLITDSLLKIQPKLSVFKTKVKGDYLKDSSFYKIYGVDTKVVFEETVKCDTTKEIELSFWLKDIDKDLVARTHINAEFTDSTGKATALCYYQIVGTKLRQYVNHNGLVVIKFTVNAGFNTIKVALFNDSMKRKDYVYFNRILVRPITETVVETIENKGWYINNFFISK